MQVQLRKFLTSALDRHEWSASRFSCFIPGERAPGTHWIGGRVRPRIGLDAVEKTEISCLVGNRTQFLQSSGPGLAAIVTELSRLPLLVPRLNCIGLYYGIERLQARVCGVACGSHFN
jgi:hypothetical protein